MASYEFAIKKDTLNSGKVNFTPVCRKKARFGKWSFTQHPWERITKIYNDYILLDLQFTPNLTFEQCEQHIQAYKEKLQKSVENQVAQEEFQILETHEI